MKVLSVVAVMLTFLFVGNANAQTLKVGVVDLEKIVTEMPEFKKSEKELEVLRNKYTAELETRSKQFQSDVSDYQKQKSMMPVTQQQSTEQKLQQTQMELQQYQMEKFGQQGEISTKRMEALKVLEEKIMDFIEKVAKKEKLTLVLNKKLGVLYADNKFDITYKVLDIIKTGK